MTKYKGTNVAKRCYAAVAPLILVAGGCSNGTSEDQEVPSDAGHREARPPENGDAADRDARPPQNGDAAGAAMTAQPGVCFPAELGCEVPTFTVIEPAPTESIDCAEGEPLRVLWETTLGNVPCRLPSCLPVNPVVAIGSTHVWASVELRPSGGATEGVAALRFGEAGETLTTVVAGLRSALEGPYEFSSVIRSTHADENGGLRWAVPAADGRGIELRHHDLDGELLSANDAVTDATPLPGQAAWESDGSSVLVYRHRPEGVPEGGTSEMERVFSGVARFDAGGRLLWHQTLIDALLYEDGDARLTVALGDVDEAGNVFVRLHVLRPDRQDFAATRLLKLDPDGRLLWSIESPDAFLPLSANGSVSSVHARPDGNLLVAYAEASFPAASRACMERLDTDGASLERMCINDEYAGSFAGFDLRGRMLLVSSYSVTIVDLATHTCEKRQIASACTLSAEGCNGDLSSLAIGSEGYLAFATYTANASIRTIGVAEAP